MVSAMQARERLHTSNDALEEKLQRIEEHRNRIRKIPDIKIIGEE